MWAAGEVVFVVPRYPSGVAQRELYRQSDGVRALLLVPANFCFTEHDFYLKLAQLYVFKPISRAAQDITTAMTQSQYYN
jgi:hypothetical protein